MSDQQDGSPRRTPLHLWIVGGIALAWNAIGAFDYLMTQTRNESYMSAFTDEQLAFFYGLPSWVVAAWAIAVWGSVLGSVLLLLRRSFAAWVFLASLLGLALTSFHNYLLSNGLEVMGDPFSLIFSAVICLIAIALLVYSLTMRKRGILG